MIACTVWPPPKHWDEVVVLWDVMLSKETHNPMVILKWLDDAPGGRYHLHGWKSGEGFAFRFENKKDATYFRLKWCT